MGMFNAMRTSTSGLSAERLRMDTISSNIANSKTTRTENGGPYRRKIAVFQENLDDELGKISDPLEFNGKGIKAVGIVEDKSPFPMVYDPAHPDARDDGYVEMPNVDYINEFVDLIASQRAFEANVTAINIEKSMYMKALEIGR
jgi:flagellar basal-body rod protein FlgC